MQKYLNEYYSKFSTPQSDKDEIAQRVETVKNLDIDNSVKVDEWNKDFNAYLHEKGIIRGILGVYTNKREVQKTLIESLEGVKLSPNFDAKNVGAVKDIIHKMNGDCNEMIRKLSQYNLTARMASPTQMILSTL